MPGASYSVIMSSADETLSNRFLTFPPDPPIDVSIGDCGRPTSASCNGRPSSASSSSSFTPRRLRWRHPRGGHDKYRLTFRQGGGDGAAATTAGSGGGGERAPPLLTFDVSGDVNSFVVDSDLTRMLKKRSMEELNRGAGDGCERVIDAAASGGKVEKQLRLGRGANRRVSSSLSSSSSSSSSSKSPMVLVEVRTLVFPQGIEGDDKTPHVVCSDVKTVGFR